MIRHIGIQYIDKPENSGFGVNDVVFTDLDTNTRLGDGWVKLDKTWILAVQFMSNSEEDDEASICIVCNSNADKSKCPIIITSMFPLHKLDAVAILTTSTESWDFCILKRSLWDQLKRMGVNAITTLSPSGDDVYMAVECVSGDKVINPIIKTAGFERIDHVEEQNPFTEIHARTSIYKIKDGYMNSKEGCCLIPYILQNTTDGVKALFPSLGFLELNGDPMFEE